MMPSALAHAHFAMFCCRWGDDPRYGRVAASHFLFDTRFWNKDSWWLWDLAVVVLEKSVGVKVRIQQHIQFQCDS
jgi:hypothetical protein